ncbi:hypothetical protein [Rubinisphaera margarita]|uniref:hypothetical protein n=1 Tax=Rubinisphaera margarita TaxID=2909586 RepID=UPI001EE94AFB|nr:hypothetical protein [Rubinisphaera margarita]MCG6158498.1 hypothetical protein [Rubinisphaera margarita]
MHEHLEDYVLGKILSTGIPIVGMMVFAVVMFLATASSREPSPAKIQQRPAVAQAEPQLYPPAVVSGITGDDETALTIDPRSDTDDTLQTGPSRNSRERN